MPPQVEGVQDRTTARILIAGAQPIFRDGLKRLLDHFQDVYLGQWGNRLTLESCFAGDWPTTVATRGRFRALLRNEPDWPIVMWAVASK